MSSSLARRDAIMMNFIFKHRQTFISVQYYNDIPILVTFQIHHIQCTLSCLRYSGHNQWFVLQLNHIVSALCLSPLSHVCRLVLCLHLHDSGRHCGEIHRSLQVNTENIRIIYQSYHIPRQVVLCSYIFDIYKCAKKTV